MRELEGAGGSYFVHASSYVDAGAVVGAGTRIWHFSHVMPGAQIGKNCVLGQNVNVGGKAIVGSNVKIQNNVSIYDAVTIEDDVFCGPSCVFTNVYNPRSFVVRKNEYRRTIVRKGASIGANATIVCGVTLGAYCLIGAGSVVTKDVPPHGIAYGNPARLHGWACKCGEKLGADLVCGACGHAYAAGEGGSPLIALSRALAMRPDSGSEE
jgi:UDP-2-acetamido-3-amino-2,3-dideoxy-glucuronate N-acetyltransferase